MRGGTLEYCVLDHCPLKKQDFSGISLRGTSFAEADLENVQFSNEQPRAKTSFKREK